MLARIITHDDVGHLSTNVPKASKSLIQFKPTLPFINLSHVFSGDAKKIFEIQEEYQRVKIQLEG